MRKFHLPTLNLVKERKAYYQQSPVSLYVLRDLAAFCRAAESCVVPGDRDKTLVLEGRREVWLRVANHFHLTPEQLYDILGGPQTE